MEENRILNKIPALLTHNYKYTVRERERDLNSIPKLYLPDPQDAHIYMKIRTFSKQV